MKKTGNTKLVRTSTKRTRTKKEKQWELKERVPKKNNFPASVRINWYQHFGRQIII